MSSMNVSILSVVEDNTTMYYYVDPGAAKDIEEKLMVDDCRMNDLLTYQDSNPNKDYIPIQAMYYVPHGQNLTIPDQYQFSEFSSICESRVFDMCGKLIGVISMGIENISFVTPFGAWVLQKFEEGLTKNNEPLESSKKKKKI
ncbi:hypothetical protein LIER_42034 [Lithospermum erythrorhizon]|uniref:Uncharacterized protein n=1 Tax=Lithospermum erythrorhizon TaxID=34254 RepID=A0AAV3RK17_LITER